MWWSRILTRWRTVPPWQRSVVEIACLGVVFFWPAMAEQGAVLNELPRRAVDPVAVGADLAMWLPFAVRRSRPVLCLALVATGFAVHELGSYPYTFATVSIYLALLNAGSGTPDTRIGRCGVRLRPVVATASAAGLVALLFALVAIGAGETVLEFAPFLLVPAVAWGLGAWWRNRARQERQRRRFEVEAAMRAERERIARDLHDVVTHHVTAMVVQADAAGFALTAAGGPTRPELAAISSTGRHALADLRRLLDVLDSTERIDDLVEAARTGGRRIEYTATDLRDPDTPVGGPAEQVSYRVVQEALTNAMKHAPAQLVTVHVRYDEQGHLVRVANRCGGPGSDLPGGGRGLAGLAERVTALGGTFQAGPEEDEFVVRSWVPGEQGAG